MKIAVIQMCLYASFIIALVLSIYICIWWYKKVAKKLNKSVENERSIENIAMKSLFYNLPSLIVLMLLFIPCLYFGGLSKQYNYCKKVIEVNSNRSYAFDLESEDFLEDCGCFDIDELTSPD